MLGLELLDPRQQSLLGDTQTLGRLELAAPLRLHPFYRRKLELLRKYPTGHALHEHLFRRFVTAG